MSADGFSFTNISALRFPAPQRYDCHSNVIWDPKQNDYIATTRDGNEGHDSSMRDMTHP